MALWALGEEEAPPALALCGSTGATAASSRTPSTRSPSCSDFEDAFDSSGSVELVVKNTFLAFPVGSLAVGPFKRRWRARSAPCRAEEGGEARPLRPAVLSCPERLLEEAAERRREREAACTVTPSRLASPGVSPRRKSRESSAVGGAAVPATSGPAARSGGAAAAGTCVGPEGGGEITPLLLPRPYSYSLRVKNTFLEFSEVAAAEEDAAAAPAPAPRAESAPAPEERGGAGAPRGGAHLEPGAVAKEAEAQGALAEEAQRCPQPRRQPLLPAPPAFPAPRPGALLGRSGAIVPAPAQLPLGYGVLRDATGPGMSAAALAAAAMAAGPAPPPPMAKARAGGAGVGAGPALGTAAVPTAGSAAHQSGKCKPCAFMHTTAGCTNGIGCSFCHLCGPGVRKRRQAERPPRPMRQHRGRRGPGTESGA